MSESTVHTSDYYQTMYDCEDHLWWYQGMTAITRAILDRFITTPAENTKILDAGCGTGAVMNYLQNYGQPYGIDYFMDALAFSRKRNNLRLGCATVEQIPFASNTFDLVTSFDVLCLKKIDRHQALQALARVVKPGGLMLLRLPAYRWLAGSAHDEHVEIGHRFTVKEIIHDLSSHGFKSLHSSYANMWLFPVACIKRKLEVIFPNQNRSDLKLNYGAVNHLFAWLLMSEAQAITRKGLPFGLTAIVLAQKV